MHGLIGATLVEWGAAVAEGLPVAERDWDQLEKELNAAGDKSFRVSHRKWFWVCQELGVKGSRFRVYARAPGLGGLRFRGIWFMPRGSGFKGLGFLPGTRFQACAGR